MRLASTYIYIVAFIALSPALFAQRVQKRSSSPAGLNDFLDKQFFIGIRGGATLSKALPVERHSVFISTTDNPSRYDKKYQNFVAIGPVAGLELAYKYLGFSMSVQPGYRRYRFSYENDYRWRDSTGAWELELNYHQGNYLDYIEIPLFLRYEFLQGALKPFVQAGFTYAYLFSAGKSVRISGRDAASGGRPFENPPVMEDAGALYIRSQLGYAAGVGLSWDLGNIRLVFDIVYRRNTHVITNREQRYTRNRLAGSGDAMDDLKLRSFTFSLGCLFPTRFLNAHYYKTSK